VVRFFQTEQMSFQGTGDIYVDAKTSLLAYIDTLTHTQKQLACQHTHTHTLEEDPMGKGEGGPGGGGHVPGLLKRLWWGG